MMYFFIQASKTVKQAAKLIGFMLLLSCIAHAKSSCQSQFVEQMPPKFAVVNKANTLRQLCLHDFTVGYAPALRSPLWSAEYLTRERLEAARNLKRSDFFHEERQLNASSRTSLTEYKDYLYDRGHLAPNFDMASAESQYDSFSLANIVPHHRWHNRNLWADVERLTRYQVYKYDAAYVVTGVAFLGRQKFLKSGLLVPSHLFKAIYIPDFNQAGVYWSKNDDSAHIEVISLAQLAERTGLDVMPSLSNDAKTHALYLPTDVADPDIDVNMTLGVEQAVELAQSLAHSVSIFFHELWQMIKQLFV